MKLNNSQEVFLLLLRAGLWEKDISLSTAEAFDIEEIYQIAQEQSVIGLIAGGLEHAKEHNVSQNFVLQIIGQALLLEQRNISMNSFIGALIDKMRCDGIYTLLIKGQGVAQCYEKPLWRACGDIDFLLSDDNYQKAVSFLKPLATHIDEENAYTQHLALSIVNWEVELHGTMRTGLWKRFDKVLDDIQNDIFYCGNVRSWMNGNTQVFLPKADEDVVYVFAHILQHFYKEGVGLRQICDWVRLFWTFKDYIDVKLLERRISDMGAMTEWKVFASLAVQYLGMPVDAMPFYDSAPKWQNKADKFLSYILSTGNFGHKRDQLFRQSNSVVERKAKMFWHITKDSARQFAIFPLDSIRMWLIMMKTGLRALLKGESK